MFKKMFANIKPHLVPETIAFFTRMLPLSILLSGAFMMTSAGDILKPFWKLILFSVIWSLFGLYLCRIVAFYVKKIMSGIAVVQDDIYQDTNLIKKS